MILVWPVSQLQGVKLLLVSCLLSVWCCSVFLLLLLTKVSHGGKRLSHRPGNTFFRLLPPNLLGLWFSFLGWPEIHCGTRKPSFGLTSWPQTCFTARFNWLSRAKIPWPTLSDYPHQRRQFATPPTSDIFPQFYEEKKTNYLLRSSRVSNSLASPFVPFSPFFSGSCPRSSFSESVSVTVLGKNCQSIQGIFWYFYLLFIVVYFCLVFFWYLFLSSSLSYFSLHPNSAVLLRVSSTSRFLRKFSNQYF